MMLKYIFLAVSLFLSACATFDRTNIQSGQRVPGPGFSFAVPTPNSWFTVEYGTSNRIKLSQLNHNDSYSILVSINKGPFLGMYPNANAHLKDLQRHRARKAPSKGYIEHQHKEWIDTRYGELCVRSTSLAEDWRGRNNQGPAMVETVSLSCEHPKLSNVLVSTTLSRRYEVGADTVNLTSYADYLFESFEF